MKKNCILFIVYRLPILILFLTIFIGCGESDKHSILPSEKISADESDSFLIAVSPPPFSEFIFPCSRCHKNIEPNRTRRKLVWAHEKINLIHDEENR